jgi:predicted RNA-binding Zn ribbon-like protein
METERQTSLQKAQFLSRLRVAENMQLLPNVRIDFFQYHDDCSHVMHAACEKGKWNRNYCFAICSY